MSGAQHAVLGGLTGRLAEQDVAQAARLAQGVNGTPGPVIHKQLRTAPKIFDPGSFAPEDTRVPRPILCRGTAAWRRRSWGGRYGTSARRQRLPVLQNEIAQMKSSCN